MSTTSLFNYEYHDVDTETQLASSLIFNEEVFSIWIPGVPTRMRYSTVQSKKKYCLFNSAFKYICPIYADIEYLDTTLIVMALRILTLVVNNELRARY